MDLWFQSDAPRIFENLTSRRSDHYRSEVHPLFSLIGYGSVYLLRRLLRLDPWTAVRCVRGAGGGRVGGDLVPAPSAAGPSSGRWGPPHPARAEQRGGAVLVHRTRELRARLADPDAARWCSCGGRRVRAVGWWVLGSAASLSITVTNWMSGLARPSAGSVGAGRPSPPLAALAWSTGRCGRSSTASFPPPSSSSARRRTISFAAHASSGSCGCSELWQSTPSLVPRIGRAFESPLALGPALRGPAPAARSRAAATIAWVALFGLGLREAARRWRTDPLVLVTLACLAGQLALHMVYGEETLLYAMHWLPLLFWWRASRSSGRTGRLARILAPAYRHPGLRGGAQPAASRRSPRGCSAPTAGLCATRWTVAPATPGLGVRPTSFSRHRATSPRRKGVPRARRVVQPPSRRSFGISAVGQGFDRRGFVRPPDADRRGASFASASDSGSDPPAAGRSSSRRGIPQRWSYDGRWRLRIRPTAGCAGRAGPSERGSCGRPGAPAAVDGGPTPGERQLDPPSREPAPVPCRWETSGSRLGGRRRPGQKTWGDDGGWGYARLPLPGDTSLGGLLTEKGPAGVRSP